MRYLLGEAPEETNSQARLNWVGRPSQYDSELVAGTALPMLHERLCMGGAGGTPIKGRVGTLPTLSWKLAQGVPCLHRTPG